MGKQPGVMLYFDIRPCLKRLTDADRGILFEAILDFGEYGVVPELDGVLAIAWDFIQPRLEKDRERYAEICEKRRAAVNTRWGCAQKGDTNEYKSIQVIPTTTQRNSTTTSASSSTPSSTGGGKTREMDFNDRRNEKIASLDAWNR